MHLRGVISNKCTDILLRNINATRRILNDVSFKDLRLTKKRKERFFFLYRARENLELLWLLLLHLLQTKGGADDFWTSFFCHCLTPRTGGNRWSLSAPHQPLPFTIIVHRRPKVTRFTSPLSMTPTMLPLWSPCWPEGPSPWAGVVPAGTVEPWRGREKEMALKGGGTQS